ncbi:MAG TPA: hypothetical protein VMU51_04270 [Mycobacteriales bacterium]|nr:hypothetical protein [Mycobacteriales bacterium]
MADLVDIPSMVEALTARQFPTVTIWNRLEGRPRSVDFGRALRAEVRDALWLLTRQWQLGEFEGDDAGTPVLAQFQLARSTVDGYQPRDGALASLDGDVPLEAVVERRPVSAALANGGLGLVDVRLALGRRFLKLVPGVYHGAFIGRYGFPLPDPDDPADTERVAHLEVWSTLQALAGRALDGYRLYRYLTDDATHRPWDGITVLDADKPVLTAAAAAFRGWADGLFEQPDQTPAWDPTRLEHRFALSATVADGRKRLVAEEYPGGHLDWTAVSIDPAGARGSGALADPTTVLPTRTRFNGMPDPRWWAFEDGRTNLGDISADTTDLARLLFVEFALVYANDWYTIPVDLPVGTLARVEGLAVTNVFGERRWIEPAARGLDDNWQRWAMFTLDIAGTAPEPADTSLLLLPALPQTTEGQPLEDVLLLRDEVGNLVWGVERTVPLATGVGRRGAETAHESLAHRTRLVGADPVDPPAPAAPIAYQVMSTVPENWIPFVPMHVPGDNRETQLQRAALPRLIEGDPNPPDRVRPRTTLLREGLPTQGYVVHEDEVTRAGTQVAVAFQRTRSRTGRPTLWLATRRETGRGESSAALTFDQIVPTPPPTP